MEINFTKAFTLMHSLVILAFLHLSFVSCRGNGFTLDLIHRDSPLSPFYNSSHNPSDRFRNAFHRSFSRASFFKENSGSIQSIISPIPGEYLMKISIGTPPVDILAVADTGSDLTWTQCEPCVDCFEQLAPIFNPKSSSSYKTVGCKDQVCQEVWPPTCNNSNICQYGVTYGDQSHTTGDLSIETFTFAESVSIPNILFGCGHDNEGTFSSASSGIIGLGGGDVSIVSQLNQQINGKFSYCLMPLVSLNGTSHINFGDTAIVSGPGVVSTPLIRKQDKTFYFLNLESISVGDNTLAFESSKISSNDQGNIIIDSGTTLTLLPKELYANLESALVAAINGTRKEDPSGLLKLCYQTETGPIDAPKIVAHFTNADVELLPLHTFTQLTADLLCLTIIPAQDDIAILGNMAQANFEIGYDLVANTISFLPTDCTQY